MSHHNQHVTDMCKEYFHYGCWAKEAAEAVLYSVTPLYHSDFVFILLQTSSQHISMNTTEKKARACSSLLLHCRLHGFLSLSTNDVTLRLVQGLSLHVEGDNDGFVTETNSLKWLHYFGYHILSLKYFESSYTVRFLMLPLKEVL